MNAEADGLRARIAVLDQRIAEAEKDLAAADITALHWVHHYEHAAWDAMRARDVLASRLALVARATEGNK